MQRAEGPDAVIVEAYIIVDIGCGDRGEVEQALTMTEALDLSGGTEGLLRFCCRHLERDWSRSQRAYRMRQINRLIAVK